MKTAIYPGSFDPITLGHLNIIRRASGIFDRVVVCIMPNAGKLHPMFTREERVALARRVVSRFPNVEVDTFDGLLAEYAKTFPEGAVIVKGLRANTDFENEFQMALINKKINPELDTMKTLPANMRRAAAKGFINATDCADYLTKKGMPFRDAYKLTGCMVSDCIAADKTLEELTLTQFQTYSPLFGADIYDAIDLVHCCE